MVRAIRLSVSDTCTGLYIAVRISVFTYGQYRVGCLHCCSELAVVVDAMALSLFRTCVRGRSRLPRVLDGSVGETLEVTGNADSGLVNTRLLLCYQSGKAFGRSTFYAKYDAIYTRTGT